MTLTEWEKLFREYLSRNRLFCTRERIRILHLVLEQSGHFSADELLDVVRKDDLKVSRATLYRTLGHLSQAGILTEADFGHGHVHYELREQGWHAHLICQKCGSVVEESNENLEEVLYQTCRERGFHADTIRIEIYGTCKTCLAKSPMHSKLSK
jgi:Fur family ferric uptake transcriptional regulator